MIQFTLCDLEILRTQLIRFRDHLRQHVQDHCDGDDEDQDELQTKALSDTCSLLVVLNEVESFPSLWSMRDSDVYD